MNRAVTLPLTEHLTEHPTEDAAMRHLLTLFDLTSEEMQRILDLALQLKSTSLSGQRPPLLSGRVLALLFEKPSLRTRVSFEAGMAHLGGSSMMLGQDVGWQTRESIKDFSSVLSQYVDVVACRTFHHETLEQMARWATCPIINALTDQAHPCQALGDLLTLREIFGELEGRTLTFVGDANNVARSLAVGCAKQGMRFVLAAPREYSLDPAFVQRIQVEAPDAEIVCTGDPIAAVEDAAAVYTDVWASMGQEAEAAQRQAAFAPYQVNEALMEAAPEDAVFLHCLPARRGLEVTDAIMDGPRSVVVQQAGNRMHAQKGVLLWLLNEANRRG